MIFISAAMYCEGAPFIQKLHLKKDLNLKKFQVFKSKDVILIFTGVGKVKSAMAITYLFSNYKPSFTDTFINLGICGSNSTNLPKGKAFLCNKLIDHENGKTYYSDLLFKTPFDEESIETCSKIINSYNKSVKGTLVDMEAVGAFQGASLFLQPHQIFIIKIVSDYLIHNTLNEVTVSSLIEPWVNIIINWTSSLKCLYEENIIGLCSKEIELYEDICSNLKFSSSMKSSFKERLTYYKLIEGQIPKNLNNYLDIPCDSKKEGKKYFEQLKQKLI